MPVEIEMDIERLPRRFQQRLPTCEKRDADIVRTGRRLDPRISGSHRAFDASGPVCRRLDGEQLDALAVQQHFQLVRLVRLSTSSLRSRINRT